MGPSLSASNVPNPLANPLLELRDSQGALLAANNDWQDDTAQAAELSAAKLAPPDELERILKRTLGVPVFQEQAMKIALDAAKFSSAEANQLRKAMATFRSRGTIDLLQDKMVERMVTRGYEREFAERCFHQIRGFGEYGFPESHAASFAHLVYVSSWLRWRYPAAFACALLNSQPMGFYAPAQIVKDAQAHGVPVLAIDVNESGWDCSLEAPPGARGRGGDTALRLGLRQVEGLRAMDAARVVAGAPYKTVEELHRRGGVPPHAIVKLAEADCFRSMGLDRRQALWDARALRPVPEIARATVELARPYARELGSDRVLPLILPWIDAQAPLPDGDINNGSLVMVLESGSFRALLTGDIARTIALFVNQFAGNLLIDSCKIAIETAFPVRYSRTLSRRLINGQLPHHLGENLRRFFVFTTLHQINQGLTGLESFQ